MPIWIPAQKWNRALRYAIAPIAVLLALGCRMALDPFLHDDSPFMYFFVAIIVSGWLGGLGPGLLATILSMLAVDYFYLSPIGSVLTGGPAPIIQNLSFLILGAAVNVIVSRLLREKQHAEKATREAKEGEAEARRAEEALKDSERRLADIIDFLPDATFALDNEGRVIAWNKAMENLTGTPATDVLGRGNYEHGYRIYGERVPCLADAVLRGIEEKWSFSDVTRENNIIKTDRFIPHLMPGGAWFSIRVAPIYDAHGNIVGVIDSGRDITERKRAEEELLNSERRYRELVQYANSAILRWKKDGTISFFNEFAQTLFGYTVDEIIGQNVNILIPQRDTSGTDLTGMAEDILNHPDRYESNVNENICRDGRRVWMSWANKAILDEHGQVAEILAIGTNITERKRAEEALQEREERLRLFIEHAPVALAMFDCQMRYISASHRWLSDYGLTGQDLRGRSHYDVFPEIPEEWKAVHRRCLAGAVERAEADRFVRADGSVQWQRWEVRPWRDARGNIAGLLVFTEDITERKQAEDALRASETRLRRVYESGLFGIIYWNMNGEITDANDEFLQMVGYDREDLAAGRINWYHMTPPEWLQLDELRVAELKATGVNKEPYEKEYIRKDGTRIPILIVSAMLDEVRFSGVSFVLDITERKRAEAALRESEARYRTLFSTMTEGFALHQIISDDQGRPCDFIYMDVNPAFERLTGIQRADLIGKRVREVMPATESHWIEGFGRVALTGEPLHIENYSSDLKRWYDVAAYRTGPGQFAAVFSDITERKRAEEALREAYGSLQAFFDHRIGGIGIVRGTAEGDIIQANDYYLDMLGYTRAELEAGQVRWVEFTPPEWRGATEKALTQLRESGVCETYEKEYFRRDGSRVPVLMTYARLPGQKGEFVAFVLDITERKRDEEALLLAKEELEQRVEERTAQIRTLALALTLAEQIERKRLAMVLHDNLQQLLVGAKLGLEMVGRKAASQDVKQSLDGVSALLDESIGASRSLTVEMAPPILYEAGLVAGIQWLGRWMREKHGLVVRIEACPEIVADTEGVCMLLFQCVRELLFNVVKHSGVNSAEISISMTDRHVRIVVADQGVGFDPAQPPKDSASGFGIFSIRERLRLMGGQMEIESAPSRGVRVSLVVPLPSAAPAPSPQ